MARVPFTILTGWLGAGKTTALNRMLGASHGKRIAVLVNELGRISIDTQLIVSRGGDVLELAGGCVCCKVDIKNDLWQGIAEIAERTRPDHVVLETTGIAEPAAILESLASVRRARQRPIDITTDQAAEAEDIEDDAIAAKRLREQRAARERIVPCGVVTVVDAESGGNALDTREEAAAQVVAADRVLLSKLDVATAEAARHTHEFLDKLAPEAERASFPDDAAGSLALTKWILEERPLRAWSPQGTHDHSHDHDGDAGHHHGNQLVAFSFSEDAPLVGERVMAVIEQLGSRLVRAKGFVRLAGDNRKGFVERAGIRTELRYLEPWPADATPKTELVLIGDDLDEAALRRALWACRAAGDVPF
ncbi:MAG TPA: GTP-binding protein [Kofleriaceae bacterium]|jgi:G3E family GTPase|nr:GTP-binding protein [Kofleriaceae bacterium]